MRDKNIKWFKTQLFWVSVLRDKLSSDILFPKMFLLEKNSTKCTSQTFKQPNIQTPTEMCVFPLGVLTFPDSIKGKLWGDPLSTKRTLQINRNTSDYDFFSLFLPIRQHMGTHVRKLSRELWALESSKGQRHREGELTARQTPWQAREAGRAQQSRPQGRLSKLHWPSLQINWETQFWLWSNHGSA